MQKEIIENFSILKDKQTIQGFYNKILDYLTLSLNEMNSEAKDVDRLDASFTKIFPMGEYTNDTYIDDSGELEILVASCDSQLISLNASYSKYYKRAKNKKEKALLSNDGTYDKIIDQLATCIASHFSNETPILIVNEGIKILSKGEFSHKVLIRFATYHENDENCMFTLWNPLEKTQVSLNLFHYIENIDKKDKDTGGNYKKLIRIYKNFRKNLLIKKKAKSSDINKYLVEVVLYNIPNFLLLGDNIYDVFTKSINYLSNADISSFVDFDSRPISKFSLTPVTYSHIKSFIYLMQKHIRE